MGGTHAKSHRRWPLLAQDGQRAKATPSVSVALTAAFAGDGYGVPGERAMSVGLEDTAERLRSRAVAVRNLGGTDVHQDVRKRTQDAATALDACANVLLELPGATEDYIARKQAKFDANAKKRVTASSDAAKPRSKDPSKMPMDIETFRVTYDLLGSKIAATVSLTALITSCADIARGRDKEAVKKLLVAGGATLGTVLAAVSGLEAVRAVAEAVSAGKDAIETTQIARYRRKQAREASAFLKWVDAVTAVANAWLYGAETYLLVLSGRQGVPEEVMYNRLALRLLGLKPSDFANRSDLEV